jgi:hypothetical protein
MAGKQLIGGFIGAFLGGAFGATGSQIGWLIGSNLAAEGPGMQDPGDLRTQTSGYGIPIPKIVGSQRLAGNLIWVQDLEPYELNESTGQVGYYLTCAIALCEGETLGWNRIWINDDLVVDTTDGIARPGVGKFYTGSSTQLPDPTIESFEGVGNVPAFRGISYVVLNRFDLGASSSIPKFEFQVLKEGGL